VPAAPARTEVKNSVPGPQKAKPRKLSFKEQQELETLPQRIEKLDAEQQQLIMTMADPAFYRRAATRWLTQRRGLKRLKKNRLKYTSAGMSWRR